MAYLETMAVARGVRRLGEPSIDNDQELVANGFAAVVGGFFRALPPAGGFSQTAVNIGAGACTQLSELVTVGLAIAAALFLGSVLSDLPQATLGAVVVVAVIGLVKPSEIVCIAKVNRLELLVASVTAVIGLTAGLLAVVGAGVVLTLFLVLVELDRPTITELRALPDGSVVPAERGERIPGLLVLRVDAPLYSANRAGGAPEDPGSRRCRRSQAICRTRRRHRGCDHHDVHPRRDAGDAGTARRARGEDVDRRVPRARCASPGRCRTGPTGPTPSSRPLPMALPRTGIERAARARFDIARPAGIPRCKSTAGAIGGTVQEATSGATGHLARFAFAPPRQFVLPAVLLLLSEEPSYGYEMVKGLRVFRFGDVDRPAVYRVPRKLEKDGLVQSWSAESKAGQARRVYGLTEDGERALRTWMGVVKEERDALDRVLRRYLSSGTPEALLAEATAGWSAFDEHTVTTNGNGAAPTTTPVERSAAPAESAPAPGTSRRRGARSAAFLRLTGPRRGAHRSRARRSVRSRSARSASSGGSRPPSPTARSSPASAPADLEIAVERLASGNRLYDAELLRRIEARRHPLVTLDLDAVTPIGPPERFTLTGSIEFHGVRRQLQGTVVASMPNPRTLAIRGEHGFDIRDFGISSPTVLMFRIYPDVMVKLQLEAELDDRPERQDA